MLGRLIPAESRVGSYFLLGSLTTFASLSALYNVTVIRPLFMRERAAAMYRSEAWLLSRVVWDIVPLRIVPTIILATILWAMAGLVRSAAGYWKVCRRHSGVMLTSAAHPHRGRVLDRLHARQLPPRHRVRNRRRRPAARGRAQPLPDGSRCAGDVRFLFL